MASLAHDFLEIIKKVSCWAQNSISVAKVKRSMILPNKSDVTFSFNVTALYSLEHNDGKFSLTAWCSDWRDKFNLKYLFTSVQVFIDLVPSFRMTCNTLVHVSLVSEVVLFIVYCSLKTPPGQCCWVVRLRNCKLMKALFETDLNSTTIKCFHFHQRGNLL